MWRHRHVSTSSWRLARSSSSTIPKGRCSGAKASDHVYNKSLIAEVRDIQQSSHLLGIITSISVKLVRQRASLHFDLVYLSLRLFPLIQATFRTFNVGFGEVEHVVSQIVLLLPLESPQVF